MSCLKGRLQTRTAKSSPESRIKKEGFVESLSLDTELIGTCFFAAPLVIDATRVIGFCSHSYGGSLSKRPDGECHRPVQPDAQSGRQYRNFPGDHDNCPLIRWTSRGCSAGSPAVRPQIDGSQLGRSGDRCRVTKKEIERLNGISQNRVVSASTPPADAPTTTISRCARPAVITISEPKPTLRRAQYHCRWLG